MPMNKRDRDRGHKSEPETKESRRIRDHSSLTSHATAHLQQRSTVVSRCKVRLKRYRESRVSGNNEEASMRHDVKKRNETG